MKRGSILLIAVLVASIAALTPVAAQSLDNKGTEFFMAFVPNYSTPSVQVHLTSDVATFVTVQYPAISPTFDTTVAVNPGAITIVTLPYAAAQSWVNATPANNVVHAFGDDEFVAYMINIAPFTSDAALALPVDTYNTEFIVMTYTPLIRSEFAVVAAYDNTTVTITPAVTLLGGHAAGVPFDVTLNRGQGILLQSNTSGAAGDLTGSIVDADRPVSVTNGNYCINVPPGQTYCDHVFEVAQPTQTWGNSGLVTNFTNNPAGSVYRILASQDGTSVDQDGAFYGMLNRGQYIETPRVVGSHEYSADKPVFIDEWMTGTNPGFGDPAMLNVIPPEQYQNRYTFSTVGGSQFAQDYLTIIASDSDVATIQLDGAAIGSAAFTAITGTGYSVATLPLTEGTHSTQSAAGHGIAVYGVNEDDSYAFPGGAAFEFINPVGDTNPPICDPASIEGAGGSGSATDDRPSEDMNGNGMLDPGEDLNGNGTIDEDTGIFDVRRAPGAFNLSLTVDPFVPADPSATFSVAQTNPMFPSIGLVRAIDGAGNSCTVLAKLGNFDPFAGFVSVPLPFVPFTLTVPTQDTTGARCVETMDPDCAEGATNPEDCMPDFDSIPYMDFVDGSLDYELDLSDGDGSKIVCCEFINTSSEASPPLCAEIVVDSQGAMEVCNGIDDDGNGMIDDGLGTLTCGMGACEVTVDACVDGQTQMCVPGMGSEESDAAMTCSDGIDNDCDGRTDVDDPDCRPLLVVLESFTAERTARGVLLEWTTIAEIDNVGFRIVATDADGGSLRAVTPTYIPAQGSELEGAHYQFLDTTRTRTGVVYYWLEDIDTHGRVTRHGPAVVGFDRPGRGAPGEPGGRARRR